MMLFFDHVTIGLPVRNEDQTLEQTLISLVPALQSLKDLRFETIVCINGSTDRSGEILKSIAAGRLGRLLNLRVISSEAGKFVAQRRICSEQRFEGPIVFLDADTLILPSSIIELLAALKSSKDLVVAYAVAEPLYRKTLTAEARFLRWHYTVNAWISPRRYFHAKLFALRNGEDLVREFDVASERTMGSGLSSSQEPSKMSSFLPRVDDVYLSYAFAQRYGLDSMREIPSSKVYYWPLSTVYDYVRALVRLAEERQRIFALFPEFTSIQHSSFRRQVRWAELITTAPGQFPTVATFRLFQLAINFYAKRVAGRGAESGDWEPLASTKRGYKPEEVNRELRSGEEIFESRMWERSIETPPRSVAQR